MWNQGHKDPTQGVRGKKVIKSAQADESESEEIDAMMGEDEQNEIREAKKKAKEQRLAA
jgi:hypothetical protein